MYVCTYVRWEMWAPWRLNVFNSKLLITFDLNVWNFLHWLWNVQLKRGDKWGEGRNVYTDLFRKPRYHWRRKCTWEDNIKMDVAVCTAFTCSSVASSGGLLWVWLGYYLARDEWPSASQQGLCSTECTIVQILDAGPREASRLASGL